MVGDGHYMRKVSSGNYFSFGKNWKNFLLVISEERIVAAEKSLKDMLGVERLEGKSFLDLGCGSGIFSLAARRLGATVMSFDREPICVECAQQLKKKYYPEDNRWEITIGSILDEEFLSQLGRYDVVYAWGVLHHTGSLWKAMENARNLLRPQGTLFLSIYNDQGLISSYWLLVKKGYNKNIFLKFLLTLFHFPFLYVLPFFMRTLERRRVERGMSLWHDMIDWLGGFPFEVANPEIVKDFYAKAGLQLMTIKKCGHRHGCNEFIFKEKSL